MSSGGNRKADTRRLPMNLGENLQNVEGSINLTWAKRMAK